MSAANEGKSSKRRAPGTGMVRVRKDGSWEARLTVQDGGRRAPLSRYAKTKEKAEAILAEMIEAEKKDNIHGFKTGRSASNVYFIQAGEGGPIKIGLAKNVKARLSELQTASPVRLKLVLALPGAGRAVEKHLHRVFQDDRLEGEWFKPSRSLLYFIRPK